MYAHITEGAIDQERPALPDVWRGPDRDWDLRDADEATMHAAGWWQVIDTARPDDTSTTTSDRGVQLVDGTPTVVWTVRDWTPEELATQAEQDARLDDLAARVARIEAHLWPAPDDPTNPDDETVGEFTGIWPDGGLIREDGTIWRNVAGVPLTTPPSGFPGTPSQWTRLFVPVLSTDPDPEPDPDPEVLPMTNGEAVKVDDLREYGGIVYRCIQAHTTMSDVYPPAQTPALWTPQG